MPMLNSFPSVVSFLEMIFGKQNYDSFKMITVFITYVSLNWINTVVSRLSLGKYSTSLLFYFLNNQPTDQNLCRQ